MNDTTSPKTGPLPIAQTLCETIEEELATLVRMDEQFAQHHAALRERRRDLLDEATHTTNELVNDLARVRQVRERQLRLLGRVLRVGTEPVRLTDAAAALRGLDDGAAAADRLLALRDRVHDRAKATRTQCQELEFALQYASDLGRELLQITQGLETESAPSRVYNQKGAASPATPQRSFLNKIG